MAAAAGAAAGVVALSGGTAWAAGAPGPEPQLAFDAPQQQATLVVPASACPASDPHCEWMLFMNAPLVPNAPVIGEVTGTAGTLTIPYPSDFCGVIQVDALIGRAPFVGAAAWTYRTGMRTAISTCQPGSGGGNTGGSGGNTGASGGNTGGSGGNTGGAGGTGTAGSQLTSLPFTGGLSTTSTSGGSTGTSTKQLPFTGADLPPILITAAGSLVVGLLLLGADERWWGPVAGQFASATAGPRRVAGRALGWLSGR